jgi:hypothetical protein
MKAGKKIYKKATGRSAAHLAAVAARRRKGISEPEKGFRFPGSMNKKKLGAC